MATSEDDRRGRHLVWCDSLGGLMAGTLGWIVAPWLGPWYDLPVNLMRFIATVNLIYGTYSLLLALSPVRKRWRVLFLIASNTAWVGVCWILAAVYWSRANAFGVTHLIAEGAVVGAIAAVEWRFRHLMWNDD